MYTAGTAGRELMYSSFGLTLLLMSFLVSRSDQNPILLISGLLQPLFEAAAIHVVALTCENTQTTNMTPIDRGIKMGIKGIKVKTKEAKCSNLL